jgi:hypothetical protein
MMATLMRGRAVLLLVGALGPFGVARAAEEPGSAVVWYRASDQCPDGASFLDATGARAKAFRLAHSGDHIDFVVTISTEDAEVFGRLERQTEAGTVAIRELRDTDCARVAGALALSLGLAVAPSSGAESPQHASERGEAEPTPEAAPDRTISAQPGRKSRTHEGPRTGEPSSAGAPPSQPHRHPARMQPWAVGVQGGVATGLQPRVSGRFEAFSELRDALVLVLPTLRVRGALVGALGSAPTPVGTVRRWVGAARLDLCPVAVGNERATIAPCAGAELGMTGAAGTHQQGLGDTDLWAAVDLRARAELQAFGPAGMAFDLGAGLPLKRFSVVADSGPLYETSSVGFFALLGVFLRLP